MPLATGTLAKTFYSIRESCLRMVGFRASQEPPAPTAADRRGTLAPMASIKSANWAMVAGDL